MNWTLAIETNRNRVLAMLAGVAAMIGNGETVLRHVRWAVLAIVRPCESSARRLIAVAAIGIAVPPARTGPKGKAPRDRKPATGSPCLALFDRRLRPAPTENRVPGYGPTVRFLDGTDAAPPAYHPPMPNDPVDAEPLRARLAALLHALDDIPGQAMRLARVSARKARPMRAMRPGRPPGYRARGKREVDEVLDDCHALALLALHEAKPP